MRGEPILGMSGMVPWCPRKRIYPLAMGLSSKESLTTGKTRTEHTFLSLGCYHVKKVHEAGGQGSSHFSTREQLRDWGEGQGSDLC